MIKTIYLALITEDVSLKIKMRTIVLHGQLKNAYGVKDQALQSWGYLAIPTCLMLLNWLTMKLPIKQEILDLFTQTIFL